MIYLDNNATTRVLPEVVEALLPFYGEMWGNPSSLHRFGASAAPYLEAARENVAALLQAQRPGEIIFTSGGTESNDLAIRGALGAAGVVRGAMAVHGTTPNKKNVVTTAVEHPSVLMLCQQLEKEGVRVTYLGVGGNGELDLESLDAAIGEATALVSVMWANNETGVIFPIEKIAKICEARNVVLHVDATQAVGKIPVDLRRVPGISLLSLSGHKLHAPKGIGALFVRRGTKISAQQLGGGQERGLRGGTQNVAGIVALGKAATLAKERLKNNIWKKIEGLRNTFEAELHQKLDCVRINGRKSPRLPNTSNISFEGCEGETICLLLSEEEIAASTGSACSAGSLEPSHVLKAMGLNPKLARGAVRFSLSAETTQEEMEKTIQALEKIQSLGRSKR